MYVSVNKSFIVVETPSYTEYLYKSAGGGEKW